MAWDQSYTDICTKLSILHLHELECRHMMELAHKAMISGEMPSSVYCHIGFDKGIESFNVAVDRLNLAVVECERLEEIKYQMESLMNQFTNKADVILSKQIQGHSLKEISAMTGYSYGYVRQQAAKYNKERTDNAKISC